MRVVLVLPGGGFRNSSPTSLAGGEHLGLGSIAAYDRMSSLIEPHYQYSFKSMTDLIASLKRFPDETVG